jgi:hypothetical protein
VSRLLRALAALAVVAVAAGAYAFVRSTTADPANPGAGQALWWRPRQITFVLNASAYQGGCGSIDDAKAAARASFLAWMTATQAGASQPCTDFKFNDCGDTSRTDLGYNSNNPGSNANLVVFRSGLCSAISDARCHPANPQDIGPCIEAFNCWSHDSRTGTGGTLALTTVTFVPSTGEILDADMELNSWNGSLSAPTGFFFTCASGPTCAAAYGGSSCAAFDIQNTVTHEAGHMLGLDHICVIGGTPPSNMCPAGDSPTMAPTASLGDINKRTLAQDDVAGVCTIYPAGSPTQMANASPSGDVPTTTVAISAPLACPSGASSSGGGGGCSTGGGGIASLLALATMFWRRRNRRA